MPARVVLVDTNVVSYRYGRIEEFERFQDYLKGKFPAISFVTYAEMVGGAWAAGWAAKRVAELETHLKSYLMIPADFNTAREWARIYSECHRHGVGTNGRENDMWIAATATRWGVPLLTNDRFFRHISGLAVLPPEEDEKAKGSAVRF